MFLIPYLLLDLLPQLLIGVKEVKNNDRLMNVSLAEPCI